MGSRCGTNGFYFGGLRCSPLIAITSSHRFTVQVGLATFHGEFITHWSAIMAGTTLTTVPVLLVFLVGQRRFVQAITGAVKG